MAGPPTRTDPARQAGDRRARGGAGAGGAALRPALAGADGGALRARVRRLARSRGRGRRLQRHHGAAPRGAGARLGRRRRGPDQPLQLRRLRQLPALRGGAAGLLRRRPRDAQPRSGSGRGGGRASARVGILPVHIFGYPAAMPELEAIAAERGLGILEDACEALGAVDSEGRRVGTRGNLATFAFYANKQMTTGEGGMIVPPDRRLRRPPALRAQPGPRRRHGLARPRRPRLQLPPLRPRRGARRRPAREARRDAGASRARSRPLRARAWPGSRASRRPIAGRGAGAAQLVRLRGPPRRGRRPRRGHRRASASVASPARPTCPASTSSRTCVSSATARASSPSPKPPRPARWRCPSSPR